MNGESHSLALNSSHLSDKEPFVSMQVTPHLSPSTGSLRHQQPWVLFCKQLPLLPWAQNWEAIQCLCAERTNPSVSFVQLRAWWVKETGFPMQGLGGSQWLGANVRDQEQIPWSDLSAT
jgi:hypothetical protein